MSGAPDSNPRILTRLTCPGLLLLLLASLTGPTDSARAQDSPTVTSVDTGLVRDGGFESAIAGPWSDPPWRFTTRGAGEFRRRDAERQTVEAVLCGAPACQDQLSQELSLPPGTIGDGSVLVDFHLRIETSKPVGNGCEDDLLLQVVVGTEPPASVGRICEEAAEHDAVWERIDVTAAAQHAVRADRTLSIVFAARTSSAADTTRFLVDEVAVVRENRPPGPTNARVSDGDYSAYNEPFVAADPDRPDRLVAASKIFTDNAGYRFRVGTFTSGDGGRSWIEHGVLPGLTSFDLVSDPVVAFGRDGAVFISVIAAPRLETNAKEPWGVFVYRSDDGGDTFGAPLTVDRATGDDKAWIAVDRSNGPHRGAVYVVWVRGCTTFISRSRDGRAPFTPARFLIRACAGTQVAVGPTGDLSAVAPTYGFFSVNTVRFVLLVSRDGGEQFDPPRPIARVPAMPETLSGGIRAVTLPALAVAPDTGDRFVAWSDPRDGTSDIWLTRSTDDGVTFSEPVRVNDVAANDQFQPALIAAADGVVVVSWFDRRADAENRLADVMIARSGDGGQQFGPAVQASTQHFDPANAAPLDTGRHRFFGDYQGLTLSGEAVVPVWNDARSGLQQLYAARLPLADLPAGTGTTGTTSIEEELTAEP